MAGTAEDPVQFIDVRDLARWIVLAAETRLIGTFDGIGPPVTKGRFLGDCAEGVGASCRYTWVDRAFMDAQGIARAPRGWGWGRAWAGGLAPPPPATRSSGRVPPTRR